MSRLRGLPPGRAGRQWLNRRLDAAGHAASLLDRKLRILQLEQERYAERAEDASRSWADAIGTAETWALRAALLAGAGAFESLHDGVPADVHLDWAALMGARYPSAARVTLPTPERSSALAPSAAVDEAARAYREATRLAVEAAVTQSALRVVRAEVAATRFRKRAIEDRWMPRLEQAAAELDLALSEAESSEGIALRLAAAARDGSRDLAAGDGG
jgi:V/A-type H+/Na+-transporting ATPase subunit D